MWFHHKSIFLLSVPAVPGTKQGNLPTLQIHLWHNLPTKWSLGICSKLGKNTIIFTYSTVLWLNLSYERSLPLRCSIWQLPQIQPYHQKVVSLYRRFSVSLPIFLELCIMLQFLHVLPDPTFWYSGTHSQQSCFISLLFQHSCVLLRSLSPASASAQTLGFDAYSGTPALPTFHITARHPHPCLALKINVLVLLWTLTLGFSDPDCDLLPIPAASLTQQLSQTHQPPGSSSVWSDCCEYLWG